MPIRSMTGFARVRKVLESGEIVVSVKSVNHRALDMHFHMAPELDAFENALRTAVKRKILRGHLQIQVRHTSERLAPAAVNESLLSSYIAAFRQAAQAYSLGGEPDLNAALTLPGVFEQADGEPDPELGKQLVTAVEEALDLLNAFREREGSETATELRTRNGHIQEAVEQMAGIRGRVLPQFHQRLSERLGDLLGGSPAIDPQRLAQETAFLADRSDVSEELTRLKVHAAEMAELLERGGEVGKKLDFLLQEMQREANTVLSKSSGVGDIGLPLTGLGLQVKAEIEKIREQALNLE